MAERRELVATSWSWGSGARAFSVPVILFFPFSHSGAWREGTRRPALIGLMVVAGRSHFRHRAPLPVLARGSARLPVARAQCYATPQSRRSALAGVRVSIASAGAREHLAVALRRVGGTSLRRHRARGLWSRAPRGALRARLASWWW